METDERRREAVMIGGRVSSKAARTLNGGPKTGIPREGFGATQLRVPIPAPTFPSLEISSP